jgi:TorA maturation chaperone TorD
MTTAAVTLHHTVTPEDQARAEIYAVLARLFSAAPDAPVLAALGASGTWPEADNAPVAAAWNRLVEASRGMDAEAADQEYTDLFIGVGKAEVNPHASYWMPDAMPRPLVAIRAKLAELGLARRDGSSLYEDHIGALLETMRFLIAGADERRPADLAVQKEFFERWVAPSAFPCCDAIITCTVANYYRRVAEFMVLYLAIERDSLAIE